MLENSHFPLKKTNAIFKDLRFLPTAVIFQMLFYTDTPAHSHPVCPALSCCWKICLTHLHVACWLLIVSNRQAVLLLVLVLTSLTCISCLLLTLHLVDNAGFVKRKRKRPSNLSLLSLSPHWRAVGYIWRKETLIRKQANSQTVELLATSSHFLHIWAKIFQPAKSLHAGWWVVLELDACHLEWVSISAAWLQRCVGTTDFRGVPTSTEHIGNDKWKKII